MTLRLGLGIIPFAMGLFGLYFPAINGPHLWFGFPSLVVWVCLCVIMCTVILMIYERLAEGGEQ